MAIGFRHPILSLLVAGLVAVAGVLGGPAEASVRAATFHVPAQPLDAALRELARQGRVQVLFPAERVAGLDSRAVRGRFEVRRAFNLALADAGFEARRVDERTLVIVAAARSASRRTIPSVWTGPPAELPEVVVSARRAEMAGTPAGRNFDAEVSEPAAVRRLSRADLDRDSAQNVTEALGALPGVTVVNTGRSFIGGVDSASRGEGLYVAYRGLNAEHTLNMVNGVSVAQGSPYSRAVQLNLLPPSAFRTIVTHKTGRADMDGDFIGGAIDFQTPRADPVDPTPRTILTVSGRVESRARDYGEDGLGGGVRVEHSRRLGPGDRIGLYVAGEYGSRSFLNSELAGVMAAQNDNGWAYVVSSSPEGGPPDPARPQAHLTLTGVNIGASRGRARQGDLTLALDWRVSETLELYLHGLHAEADTQQNSTFSQVVSGPQRWTDDGAGLYRLSVDTLSSRVWYETNPDRVSLSTLSLGGVVTAGRWRLAPSLFASHGASERPDHIEASVWVNQNDRYNQNRQPRAFGGLTVRYENDLPVPQWPAAVFDDLDQAGQRLLARRGGQLTEQFSHQLRYGGGLDLTFTPEAGAWRSFRLGAKWGRSERDLTDRNWTNAFFAEIYGAPGLTWADLGVVRGTYAQVFPGLYGWSLPKVQHDRLVSLFHAHRTEDSFDSCGSLYVNNLNCNSQSGGETVQALYAMATRIDGPWEVQAGLRYERTRIDNTFWVLPDTAGGETPGDWGHSRSRYDKLLPSLNLNYRPDGETVWRAALWRAYSRPAFMRLGGGSRSETVDGLTTVTRGNPDLRSVDAVNLDLGYQKALAGGSALSLSAYYKRLDHYLFDGGSHEDDGRSPAGGPVRVVTPQNGGRGEIHGLEAEFFHALPDPLGLGGEVSVQVNVSRQWSRVDLGSDELGRAAPMQNAPDWLGNVDVAYRRGPGALYLSYNHRGAYLSRYDALGAEGDWDNLWVRPLGQLDARIQWRLRPGARLDVIVTNLTDAYSYWAHVGRDSLALSDVIHSGRRMVVSLRSEF